MIELILYGFLFGLGFAIAALFVLFTATSARDAFIMLMAGKK